MAKMRQNLTIFILLLVFNLSICLFEFEFWALKREFEMLLHKADERPKHWGWENSLCDRVKLGGATGMDPHLHCHVLFVARIKPVYAEILQAKPLMIWFHELLTPNQQDKFMQIRQKQEMKPASTGGVAPEAKSDGYRVSNSTFVIPQNYVVAATLEAEISRITGLHLISDDAFNLLVYQPGGHYALHFDWFGDMPPLGFDLREFPDQFAVCFGQLRAGLAPSLQCFYRWLSYLILYALKRQWSQIYTEDHFKNHREVRGNRLITWMQVVQSAEVGGGTVFPMLDMAVKPEAGDAIFWVNTLPDGMREDYSVHGGCPVIQGEKAVLTLWHQEKLNEFNVKCPIENTKFGPDSFINGILKDIPSVQ